MQGKSYAPMEAEFNLDLLILFLDNPKYDIYKFKVI